MGNLSLFVKFKCATCGTLWRQHGPFEGAPHGAWQLWDAHQKPGPCCDNAPGTLMAVQEEPEPILRWFQFDHLPSHLRDISLPFCELAHWVANRLPRSAERTFALRKLLEAKDAAVRASLP